MSADYHNMPRQEWEAAFRAEFVRQLGEDPGDQCIANELESWPAEDDDWRTEPPEQAADSCLSYWEADE